MPFSCSFGIFQMGQGQILQVRQAACTRGWGFDHILYNNYAHKGRCCLRCHAMTGQTASSQSLSFFADAAPPMTASR